MGAVQQMLGVMVVVAACSTPVSALAIGSDYDKPPSPGPDWWAPALRELVRNEHWVHGYLVNAEDKHFYAGNTEAINEFLQAYAQLDETRLEIVLHEGTHQATSPWNKSGEGRQANWALYIAPRDWLKHSPRAKVNDADPPTITQVDVWLGSNIDADALSIPLAPGMTVRAHKEFQGRGSLHLRQRGE